MRSFFLVSCLIFATCDSVAAADFEKKVALVLIKRCLECHKGSEPAGGLRLDSESGLQKGGDSGPSIAAGKPQESLLIERIRSGEMPPPLKGVPQTLPVSELEALSNWIASGAVWPAERTLDLYEVTTDVRGGRDWWAFQPVQRPMVPKVKNIDTVANAIDAFIVARLEHDNFVPARQATARNLVRRLFMDVIGLPPSFAVLQDWTARIQSESNSAELRAEATEELIDHLLASPHFGERWARFWLDLVRYAESSGYERDQPKPFAWKYRDWVVNAINTDMPYDQFIRHQLAGDEINNRSEQSVIATGFLRLGTWNDEPNDDQDYRYERLEDMVHATSSAFLGLTVKCARCHDHKFDPIPQDDYYRMASSFWAGPIAARDRKLLGGPSAKELGLKNVLGWTDLTAVPPPLHVLKNGERDKPLNAVESAPLTFAPALFRTFDAATVDAKTSGRRRQLADWIASSKNPLTARVFVNRLWQHHFGEGLVRSPNNFGYKGDPPTHPELLDWLASELIDSGWSAKHIHKLILMSRTWQQSSLHPQAAEYTERDSTNRMWWRANRRRLNAEALRDSLLVASGEIDLRIGGEGFKPTISAEALEGFSRKGTAWQAAPSEEQRRRSLYIYVSRSLMPPMMTTFDQSDTTLPCAQRDVTTVAPQALAMLNNEFSHARSDALATRAATDAKSVDGQIDAVWKLALGRFPANAERRMAAEHLIRQRQRFEQASVSVTDRPTPEVDAIPGLVLLLAAATGVTASDSGHVSKWQSSTGRHHAAQLDRAAQPQLVSNAINGQPAVRFDGQQRFLQLDGEVLNSEHCTIFAVATDRAIQPGLREIISNWNRADNVGSSLFLGLRDTNTVRFSDDFSSAGEIKDRSQPFLLTAMNAPDGVKVWQNALLIAARTHPVTGRRFGTAWVIGQQGDINGEYWNGDIAEIRVFNRPLNEDERLAVWHQLLTKYKLPQNPAAAPQISHNDSPAHRALTSLCHVLLNSNEFLYID